MAIVHHWFVSRGGGERVAECIASLFPDAEIFTLVAAPRGIPESFAGRVLHTSFLQKIPLARRFHRQMMPFYPLATRSLNLRGFDLVLSSDSGTVKGVSLDPGAVQICYCHSPMRYLWDNYEAYRQGMDTLTRALFTATAERVRRWDVKASDRVTYFIANSYYVAGRIQRFYGRESTVIHPPIDLDRAVLREVSGVRPYLAAGRLVSYKRTELMIEACQRLGRELRIAGAGPEEARLRSLAAGHVTFLGEMSNDALWREYSLCRALLFAADEDFGMVPLEAQACGRPVVAYGAGGSLETVRASTNDGDTRRSSATGVYFDHQTVESMMEGILRFESLDAEGAFNPHNIRQWAEGFSTTVFLRTMRRFILDRVPGGLRSNGAGAACGMSFEDFVVQGMRDILRGSLRESLRAMSAEDRLIAAWPVACGRAMAERGRVAGFADGVLQIHVGDAAWLAQMRSMRAVLEHDLARIAGVRLSAIHFELKTISSQ